MSRSISCHFLLLFVLQVEAALTVDPENEQLLKLKTDLQVNF